MIYDHPEYGQFRVELDFAPTLSVNHRVGMAAQAWHAMAITGSLNEIAEFKNFTATSLTKQVINNVGYALHASIVPNHYLPEFKVRWNCGMTDSAKKKFNAVNASLNADLLAFVVEHDAELRAERVSAFQAHVAEVVAALRGNADAMERAAGHPEPASPAERHAQFITQLMNGMRDTLLGKVARFPEDWDGYELRELIKDYVAENAPVGTGMNRSRKAAYDNEVLVRNLT